MNISLINKCAKQVSTSDKRTTAGRGGRKAIASAIEQVEARILFASGVTVNYYNNEWWRSLNQGGGAIQSGIASAANPTTLVSDETATLSDIDYTTGSDTGSGTISTAPTGAEYPDPAGTIGPDNFSDVFTGQIAITTAGAYTFDASGDDSVTCFVDDQLVSSNGTNYPITLTSGEHDIEFFHEQGVGLWSWNLSYSGADTGNTSETVPNSVLTTASGALVTPTGLTAVAGQSQVTLTWNENNASALRYVIQRSSDAAFDAAGNVVSFDTGLSSASAGTSTTESYTDLSFVRPSTKYYYRIEAQNYSGSSAFTTTPVSATTAAAPTGTYADSFQSFTGSVTGDGSGPQGGVILDSNGNLFGTTTSGGANNDGTIFELTKSGTLTTLASFNGTNGKAPASDGQLQFDSSGDLFGTATSGGANGNGDVWELPSGSSTITDLADFNGTNGNNPAGGVTRDSSGNLFGTAVGGGTAGAGTVWELPSGSATISVLANFNTDTDLGFQPYDAPLFDANGDLFGTYSDNNSNFYAGGGGVWELAKGSHSITDLATNFGYLAPGGANVFGGLVRDSSGDLFGTAEYGYGQSYYDDDAGLVWELPSGANAVTTVAVFNYANGASPLDTLVMDGSGNLFGTTSAYGPGNNGTVFEIKKGSGQAVTVFGFNGTDGSDSVGSLAIDSNGDLFGTASGGGINGAGTVFELQHISPTPTPTPTHTLTATGKSFAGQGGKSTGTVKLADFTDSNSAATAGLFTASINWEDGTPATAGTVSVDTPGVFKVTASHTYTTPGKYSPVVTITGDGTSTHATAAAAISNGPLPVITGFELINSKTHAVLEQLTSGMVIHLGAYSASVQPYLDIEVETAAASSTVSAASSATFSLNNVYKGDDLSAPLTLLGAENKTSGAVTLGTYSLVCQAFVAQNYGVGSAFATLDYTVEN